jgi:hypothetical protein
VKVSESKNRGGRPRESSFRQDMEIALCIGEARRVLAGIGRSSQHPELPRILKQIGRETKKNTVEFRIGDHGR